MLIQLKLENIALIEIIEINFEKGLNIFTGDSGSGKSLILDSLNVLFGGTNIPLNHLIRPGKNHCFIEAKFSNSSRVNNLLIENGFQNTFSELVIKRKSYKKNNKISTKYTINNLPINKKFLEKIGMLLIDFAGQSDSFLYNSQDYRRSIIDDLGSKQLNSINLEVKNTWKKYEKLKETVQEKRDFLKRQNENNKAIQEMFNILDQANLNSSNEIIELELLENRLVNNFQINNSIQEVLNNLNYSSQEMPSVAGLVSQSIKHLNKISSFDKKIKEFEEKLLSVQIDIESLIFELKRFVEEVESFDMRLEEIQKRLFLLKNLERTFSLELPQLINKREELRQSLLIGQNCNEIKMLEDQINNISVKLDSLFNSQSSLRRQIAKNLENSVMSLLKSLGLTSLI